MKKIIFVRHAKSSWEYNVDDKDRPLKIRGIKDAHLVSNHVNGKFDLPDAVFSSHANRALHTCVIFLRNLGIPFAKLEVTPSLYDFGGGGVSDFLQQLDDTVNSVMIFGHNYAFTSLVNIHGSKYVDNLPTSGFVAIEFDVESWKDIDKGTTVLTVFPKELK